MQKYCLLTRMVRLLRYAVLCTALSLLPLAALAASVPLRFAWLSDTHVGSDTGEQDLNAAVNDINSLTGLSFVVISGDVTEYGSREQFKRAKQSLDKLKLPYHILPGNHDAKWSESGATDFARFWPADRFVFEQGGFRFIGLHQGPLMKMGDGHWAPQDVRWLKETLAQLPDPNQPIIFITHYPIDNGIANWYVVLDLLKRYNTQVVLCGHGHGNQRYLFEGVPGVMGRSSLRANAAAGGFNLVEIKDGVMTFSERITGRPTSPPWYAGQCPLLDQGAVILAPGGDDALLLAVEALTGKVLWRTPNPQGWKMTHSSVMPMEFDGQRMYVYCASKGVVGASAHDGSLLWETPDWKISIATVPSPLPLDGGRLFLTGGYNAGSLMLQLTNDGGRFVPRTLFKLAPEVFGATQHTPIRYHDHLYGVRADGKFVCLTLDGKVVWASGSGQQFGLGSFILANGLILSMNDSGLLRLIEALPQKYTLLAQAQVLKGRESWAPLALAGGRLIVRDLTRMVCLEVGRP